ncbi:hypothetical protein [Mycobacterium spongiae]|uniref:Uncharacterized protein n=1 Tax=Mycobacterium spongiae TaxID=886343 RepID=A0A975PXK2_9MYCO|nr:hypothetical protein [Mycobacterium spongiae]QUR67843.1 hypothetical protein F6B93_12650 [Mycobacterium spongiae]
MTDSARDALEHLRDISQFQWYVVPLFVLVIYVYSVELERRNWNVFFAGLAFWGMDWFNEIWNALVFHGTGRAPVWGARGSSAYQILIGLNVEIWLMFAVLGVAAAKMLPPDPRVRILGIPNRWLLAVVFAWLCVAVEIGLNVAGILTWDYWWWQASMPVLIFLLGYLPFFAVSFWVHDMRRVRSKAIVTGVIFGVDVMALIVFDCLGWI